MKNLSCYNTVDKLVRSRMPLLADAMGMAGYRSVRQMCKNEGMNYSLTLKLITGNYNKPLITQSGDYDLNVRRLSAFVCECPETLFPEICNDAVPESKSHDNPYHFLYNTLPETEVLQFMYNYLTPRQRQVIKLRYGFADGHQWSFEEIGSLFNVTRWRIYGIIHKALRRMRHAYKVYFSVVAEMDRRRDILRAAEMLRKGKTA